jgi:hypothetical protein
MTTAVLFRWLAARHRLEAAMWAQRAPVIRKQLVEQRGTAS